ncbi:MAG: DNA polymerase III subunit delta [Sandaracinaceae bacterium]
MAKGAMEIGELIDAAREGRFRPVHVLTGSERFLIERAIGLLKRASVGDGIAGFNDDLFHGATSLAGQKIVNAARTLPMMASARFVLVRNVDAMSNDEQQPLAEYLEHPVDSTCLVLTAEKLHASSRLAKAAKSTGALTDAKPLKGAALRRFTTDEAKRRGHAISGRAADALLEAMGEDLAAIDDALERLSLYLGDGGRIDENAVEACVSRIAADSIWALVDAIGVRDTKTALAASASLLAAREPALRILGMVARQLRIVARMRDALRSGLRGKDAALEAGAPPFKADELTKSASRFSARDLAGAFTLLAEADLALKGSKRPPERVLEEAVLALCAGERRVRERIPRVVRTYR